MIIQGKKQAKRNVYTATGLDHEVAAIPSTNFVKYMRDDAVLNSNLRQLQDGVFEKYPRIDDSDNTEAEEMNRQLDSTGFGKKFKNQFPALWHNGNMFFEIDVIGNKLIGFYEIDASTMKVIETDNGEVREFIQSHGPNSDLVIPKEKIIHIKAPSLRTGVIGEALLTPLTYPLARKQDAENVIAGSLNDLQTLLTFNLGDDDDDQAKAIQNELRSERKPTDRLRIIGLLPEEKVTKIDLGSTMFFTDVQNYIDSQNDEIIRVVQIPPIVAGTTDNSNRSNSEIQERAVFGRTSSAWQNFFVNELNLQFEEKVGWKDFTFEFPQIDDRKQEAALVRADKFKNLGYSQKAIHKVLQTAGIKIDDDFEEIIEETPVDKDEMPSRAPRPKTGIPQNEEKRKADAKNKTKKVEQ